MARLRFARYLFPVGLFLLVAIWGRLPWLSVYLPPLETLGKAPQALVAVGWGLTAVLAMVKGPGEGRRHHIMIQCLSLVTLVGYIAGWRPLADILMLATILLGLIDPLVVLNEEERPLLWAILPTFLTIGVYVLCLWRTGDYLSKPGGVFHMHEIVQVEKGQPQDEIMALYVNIQPATLLDRLLVPLHPTELITAEEIAILSSGIGDELRNETQQMAVAVALKQLGQGKGALPKDWVDIAGVNASGPSAKLLKAGDQIRAIDGNSFAGLEEMRAYLRQQAPDHPIQITVWRDGQAKEVTVILGKRPDGSGDAYLGITMQTGYTYDIPVKYTASDRGNGNSYGAVFALTVLDQLTPGGVTGGHVVAGTGTIEADGRVGLVGSVTEKAFVAARSGADVLFVPVEQADEARAGAGTRLAVVPVHTLQEMLDWLQTHPKR